MGVVNTVVLTSALTSLSLIKTSHYDFLRNGLAPFIIFQSHDRTGHSVTFLCFK